MAMGFRGGFGNGPLAAVCAAALLFAPSAAAARPVSLHAVDADVRAVLASVAELGDTGLVLDDSVRGTVTIHLDGVEPREAFRLIAAAGGLSLGESGGVTVLTAARAGTQGLYRPYVFPVRYAALSAVREAVALALMPYADADAGRVREIDRTRRTVQEDGGTRMESHEERRNVRADGVRVFADETAGAVVLYATSSEAEAAGALIALLDQPPPQVSLEAKVVAVDRDAARELGVEWAWSALPQYPDYTTEYETRRRTVQNPDGSLSSVTEDVPKETTRRTWDGGTGAIPGIIRFGRGPGGHPFEFYYAAKLNALVTDGRARLLARPNITTLQGREAVINIGGEVPVPTVSVTNATTTTSVTYRDAGIILRCTPRVSPDGGITVRLHTEVSSPSYVDAIKAYRFSKRSADTEVRLRDGETMVIGGLIGSEESKSLSQIPLLGDIPILGALFRNERKSKTDSEIMIFLTAKIMNDTTEGAVDGHAN